MEIQTLLGPKPTTLTLKTTDTDIRPRDAALKTVGTWEAVCRLKRWETETLSAPRASWVAGILIRHLWHFTLTHFTAPCQIIHRALVTHPLTHICTRMSTDSHTHTCKCIEGNSHMHTVPVSDSRPGSRLQAPSDKYEACNATAETGLMGSIKNRAAGHRENTARG